MLVNSNEKEKTFKELYLKYYDKIYNYIFRSVFNKETAEDITSNVFFNALNHIKNKNPKIENFSSWLYKIGTNEIIQFKKKDKSKDQVSLDDEFYQLKNFINGNYNKNGENYEDFVLVHNELEKLSQAERDMISLYFFENKDYSEISLILNIKVNTLRPMMSRTLKKLYERLKFKII